MLEEDFQYTKPEKNRSINNVLDKKLYGNTKSRHALHSYINRKS